jgi:hypothetical protein
MTLACFFVHGMSLFTTAPLFRYAR